MSTSSPTELPKPSEPADDETAPVESSATTVLTKDSEDSEDAPATPKVWTPRPNDVLSPEDKDPEDLTDEELEDITSGGLSKGILGGAAAISAAALGLVSISGTWFSTIILTQTQFNASLNASGKSTATQLAEGYTGPWHTMAWHNGIFAAVAILVGAAVLFGAQFLAVRVTPNWIKAVAIAAVVLGFVGLLVSAGMYFDWFSTAIHVPPQTAATTPAG
ncbi:hypothetical protein ACEZCY_30435 [Streptacidiphilus sp. N1-12]|uniref:Uncharacterized protein n=2 Tax=Streptacidiphilus alkalitolerans TaxID=3342712 RepID=A0ABV6WT31_9ACTN